MDFSTANSRKEIILDLFRAQRFGEAKALGEALCRAHPQDAEAWRLLGVIEGSLGQVQAAETCLRKAIEANPQDFRIYFNLADAVRAQGRPAEAIAAYEQALRLKPDLAEAWNGLGLARLALGQPEEAAASIREAVRVRPNFALAYNNLGFVHGEMNQFDEAVACYREALRLKPNFSDTHVNLGIAFSRLERQEEAIGSFETALRLNPAAAEVYCYLGRALAALYRYTEAEGCYREAIRQMPALSVAYNDLGLTLYIDGSRHEEAEGCFRKAIGLDPAVAEFHGNLGRSLYRLGRYEEAGECYNAALACDPDYSVSRCNLGIIQLMFGHFREGWSNYAYRPTRAHYRPTPAHRARFQSVSLAASLAGKRLLLDRDQGLGDELFFLRFAPELKRRGGWVAYCPNPKLASIFSRLDCLDRLVTSDEPVDGIAYSFSVGDLPLLLGMDEAAKIPPPLTLSAIPDRLQAMQEKLSALGPRPYVGVTWRAGTEKTQKALYKETPKAMLADTLKDLPVTVLVLQRLPEAGEIEAFTRALGRPAHDLSAVNDDLEDMLALLSLLDDYVGVSNTNMHLMAGLGKSARVLAPHPPEWRWMAQGKESPWFRGFKVYRQGQNGAWGEAFGELAQDMKRIFGGTESVQP